MSVARFLCPQLLEVALRTTQQPVDVETIGVGADLRRDPGDQPHEGSCQRLPETELALEARQRYLHLLPLAALPEAFGHQQDARLGQSFLQRLASIGQVPKESAREVLLESRSSKQFLGQA